VSKKRGIRTLLRGILPLYCVITGIDRFILTYPNAVRGDFAILVIRSGTLLQVDCKFQFSYRRRNRPEVGCLPIVCRPILKLAIALNFVAIANVLGIIRSTVPALCENGNFRTMPISTDYLLFVLSNLFFDHRHHQKHDRK